MYNKQNALKDVADYWRKVKSGELPAPSPNDIDFTIWTAEAAMKRIAELERLIEGVTQEAIAGGWTAKGISDYAKSLEAKLATPVRLPTKYSLKLAGDKSTRAMFSGHNSAINDSADAIRAAGFTVEGDE
ncbi:hypothetical protein [Serratia marcescens]|uniref:hypothetical protein n=1 Tax=Serratia marcescens TaxID=615 RepID=UPI003EDA9208